MGGGNVGGGGECAHPFLASFTMSQWHDEAEKQSALAVKIANAWEIQKFLWMAIGAATEMVSEREGEREGKE